MAIYNTGLGASSEAQEKTYHVRLTFSREDLLYDIRNACYIEGHIMPEGAEHAKHMTKDVGEKGNVDRITRLLNLYHKVATEMLYPFAKSEIETAETAVPWNDRLAEPEVYAIDLKLPGDFSETTVNLLEHWIHEYLVAKCVCDWLSITYPDKAANWGAKAVEAEAEVRRGIARRRGRIRRTQSPF